MPRDDDDDGLHDPQEFALADPPEILYSPTVFVEYVGNLEADVLAARVIIDEQLPSHPYRLAAP
jgi:hypothetical protein